MANEVLLKYGTLSSLTITLASLASSTAGVGRQSTLVSNTTTRHMAADIFAKVTVGTSPAANTGIYFYLLEADDAASPTGGTDACGASDAAITIKNARLLGVLSVPATTSDTAYQNKFHIDHLPAAWGVAVVHDTTVNLNSTAGNHFVKYQTYCTEVQ